MATSDPHLSERGLNDVVLRLQTYLANDCDQEDPRNFDTQLPRLESMNHEGELEGWRGSQGGECASCCQVGCCSSYCIPLVMSEEKFGTEDEKANVAVIIRGEESSVREMNMRRGLSSSSHPKHPSSSHLTAPISSSTSASPPPNGVLQHHQKACPWLHVMLVVVIVFLEQFSLFAAGQFNSGWFTRVAALGWSKDNTEIYVSVSFNIIGFLLPLVGGILADCVAGRIPIVVLALLIRILGMLVVVASALPSSDAEGTYHDTPWVGVASLIGDGFVSLSLLGRGATLALLCDQFEIDARTRNLSWPFYWCLTQTATILSLAWSHVLDMIPGLSERDGYLIYVTAALASVITALLLLVIGIQVGNGFKTFRCERKEAQQHMRVFFRIISNHFCSWCYCPSSCSSSACSFSSSSSSSSSSSPFSSSLPASPASSSPTTDAVGATTATTVQKTHSTLDDGSVTSPPPRAHHLGPGDSATTVSDKNSRSYRKMVMMMMKRARGNDLPPLSNSFSSNTYSGRFSTDGSRRGSWRSSHQPQSLSSLSSGNSAQLMTTSNVGPAPPSYRNDNGTHSQYNREWSGQSSRSSIFTNGSYRHEGSRGFRTTAPGASHAPPGHSFALSQTGVAGLEHGTSSSSPLYSPSFPQVHHNIFHNTTTGSGKTHWMDEKRLEFQKKNYDRTTKKKKKKKKKKTGQRRRSSHMPNQRNYHGEDRASSPPTTAAAMMERLWKVIVVVFWGYFVQWLFCQFQLNLEDSLPHGTIVHRREEGTWGWLLLLIAALGPVILLPITQRIVRCLYYRPSTHNMAVWTLQPVNQILAGIVLTSLGLLFESIMHLLRHMTGFHTATDPDPNTHIWILFPAGFFHAWGFMLVFIGGASLLYNYTPATYRATSFGLQWSFWSVADIVHLLVVETIRCTGVPVRNDMGYDTAAAIAWLVCAAVCGLGAVGFWGLAKRWAKL